MGNEIQINVYKEDEHFYAKTDSGTVLMDVGENLEVKGSDLLNKFIELEKKLNIELSKITATITIQNDTLNGNKRDEEICEQIKEVLDNIFKELKNLDANEKTSEENQNILHSK